MNRNKPRHLAGLAAFCVLLCLASAAFPEKSEDSYTRAAKLYADGRHAEALESAKQALAEAEKKHGPASMDLSRQLNLLADIHQKRGEWQEASGVLERLRSIQEANLGTRNIKIAKTVGTLITVYEQQGDAKMAEQLNQLAAARWGRQEPAKVNNTAPLAPADNDPGQKDHLTGKWKKLSSTANYSKIAALIEDYSKKHKYLKEDFFVCSDMAIEVWNIIKTSGINARIMVGNVDKDIVKYKSSRDYLTEMNHVWVMAEVLPLEWIPIEATVGVIVHPKIPSFNLYRNGTYFDNPKRFKQFNESRTALFQTCKEASIMVDNFNSVYAGKPATTQLVELTGRTKQKVEDCTNLEHEVLSYLSN
jgi:tetratricopeptide (TPR) repeat protein